MPWLEHVERAIHDAHAFVGHQATAKTYQHIQTQWTDIPRDLVDEYVRRCPVCSVTKHVRLNRGPLRNPKSHGLFSRVQLDLMDFSTTPGGANKDMKWIMHLKDHWSRFSWLYAIKDKSGI